MIAFLRCLLVAAIIWGLSFLVVTMAPPDESWGSRFAESAAIGMAIFVGGLIVNFGLPRLSEPPIKKEGDDSPA
jgi:hypothetical protein